MADLFIYLTEKVDGPEKTMGPSGCEAFLPLYSRIIIYNTQIHFHSQIIQSLS
ncbi:MAG TPA: hypothetical protein VLA48_04175 [Nitrososphaeraceae archaeon]|jgi:hypothetical protein|nr:hypothetical protein [Nitrososphaeraceae archaeon]